MFVGTGVDCPKFERPTSSLNDCAHLLFTMAKVGED